MTKIFDISNFHEYIEDNRLEVKRATNGLPISLWETYSAFANGYGGVIILGVKEKPDGKWATTGLKDESKLKKEFWDIINNKKKVSENILSDDNISTYKVNVNDSYDIVMVIHVPMARRNQKPIYINNDLFHGTFRRNWEGDYHCTKEQVKAMLRDQVENGIDMEVLENASIEDLNKESIRMYRNRHRALRPAHPFERLDDLEYLRSIGALAVSKSDNILCPTAAGMLMFGNEYNIIRHFPDYFLDYREILDKHIRWTDRVQSSSGDWSGNLFDYYFIAYNKIIRDLKIPFKVYKGNRIDDTDVHEAIREALANTIINADFYQNATIKIIKEQDKIVFENAGYIRVGKDQMKKGGISDPRNKALMKMFNLINIGERAGSGVVNIFNIWADNGWKEPDISELFNPDRTILILEFTKKQAIKTSDKKQAIKTSDKKQAIKTIENMRKIELFLKENGTSKTSDIAEYLGLSPSRTRAILNNMNNILSIGGNANRKYQLKDHT